MSIKKDNSLQNLKLRIGKREKKYGLFLGLVAFAMLNTGFTAESTTELPKVKVQEAVEVTPSDEMKLLISEESKSLPSGITVSESGMIALAESDSQKQIMNDVVNKTLAKIKDVDEMKGLNEGEAIEEPEIVKEIKEEKSSSKYINANKIENTYDDGSAYASMMAMEATAYLPTDGNGQGITAMGIPATYGIAAVDPSVIPLGTRLYVPGYGEALAADTGGAINGYRIDLCMESYEQAMNFGRRTITVYVMR